MDFLWAAFASCRALVQPTTKLWPGHPLALRISPWWQLMSRQLGAAAAAESGLRLPGTALAFSLVLRGSGASPASGRLAGLGAMAVADACELLGLQPEIKWPNDVLLKGRKLAGILVEVTLERR